MKKCIVILASYPVHLLPRFSGDMPRGTYATWLPQLADEFSSAEDLDIHWVTFSKAVDEYCRIQHLGQSFHVFPRKKTSVQACTMYWSERRIVRKLIKNLNAKVVHAWGTEDEYALSAADFKGFSVLSMQGIMSYYCKIVKNTHWLQRIQARYERYALKRVDLVTCESIWGGGILRKMEVSAPILQIEHGVNPRFYESTWMPDPKKPIVFFAGSVIKAKGISDLLEAFSRECLSGYTLLIAGDGPMERDVAALNLRNVKLLGRISMEEMIEHLQQSWCLVLPTRVDTSPNVVKEARVMGLPVVTTPCGGQSDYIEDGVNGYLVEPENIDGLVNALLAVLSNFDQCRQYGMAKHMEARRYFSHHNTVNQLLEIYRKKT